MPLWLLGVIAFPIAIVLLGQGITTPFTKDQEPQYAQWIESATDGSLLLQRDYYGGPAEKPPLFFVTSAAVVRLSGGRVNEAKSRAVSLIAGAALATLLLIWAASTMGIWPGLLAFLFIVGSYGFAARATLAQSDMLLAFFMFGSWLLIYPHFVEPPSSARTVLIGVAFGLGILTKGPIAVLLPAIAAITYQLLARLDLGKLLCKSWPWRVATIALAISALWYVPGYMAAGHQFAHIALKENLGHFLPPSMGGTGESGRPWFYIVERTFGAMLPMSLLLPLVIVLPFGDWIGDHRRTPTLYHVSYAMASVLFFTAAAVKRDDYVLPALPSLAICFAALFTIKPRSLATRIRDIVAAGCVTTLLLGLIAGIVCERCGGKVAQLSLDFVPRDQMLVNLLEGWMRTMRWPFELALGASTMAAIATWSGVLSGLPELTGTGLGIVGITGVLLFTAAIRPMINQERTLKYAAAGALAIAGDSPLYVVGRPNYELAFYAKHAVPPLSVREASFRGPGNLRFQKIEKPSYLFAYDDETAELQSRDRSCLRRIRTWPVAGQEGSPSIYEIDPSTR